MRMSSLNIYSPPRWFLLFLLCIVCAAIFRDFIAGDKAIIAYSEETGWDFPIFAEAYANADSVYAWRIMPLIPYNPEDITSSEQILQSPISAGKGTQAWRYYHWLGTDGLGRDVLAGIIYGCRIALIIAFISAIVSLFFGYSLGAIAGYYGDKNLRMNAFALLAIGVSLVVYVYHLYWQSVLQNGFSIGLFFLFLAFLAIMLLLGLRYNKPAIAVPMDFLIMRGVDFLSSVPALLVLLVLSVAFKGWNVFEIAILIGFLRWPVLCRHVRAEVKAIKSSEEIEYAKGLGFSDYFILSKRIFLRSIQPAGVVLAFVTTSSIVLEATLSFLGLGLPAGVVSWGNLIQQCRTYPDAWWLVFFPGLMLFLIVLGLNQWGKRVNKHVHQTTR